MTVRRSRVIARLFGTCLIIDMSGGAMAQSAVSPMLASAELTDNGQCHVIDVAFNRPIALAGQFPSGNGTEFRISITEVGTAPPGGTAAAMETVAPAPGNQAALISVSYDPSSAGQALVLKFGRPVYYRPNGNADPRHVRVLTSSLEHPDSCSNHQNAVVSDNSGNTSNDAIAEGKKSLRAKDYARAVALFTKVTTAGMAKDRKEAQELLGVAHEQADHLAQARAAYAAYLKLYSEGGDAERVRQRLAGVLAAIESDASAQFEARKRVKLESTGGASVPQKSRLDIQTIAQGKGNIGATSPDEQGWKLDSYGSFGQTYYRYDRFSGFIPLRGSLGLHDVGRNDIVSSGDITITGKNGPSEIKVRVSGYEQSDIEQLGQDERTTLSTAYVDMRNSLTGLSARIGRQTRYDGGVFGRFDGALVGATINDTAMLQAVLGSPVYYGDTDPFADGRFFYGLSLELATRNKVWSTTLYALEQDIEHTVDRRALGAELRYAKGDVSGYAAADYDVYFNELNSATLSGSWNIRDGVSVYGNLDYRHVPFLLTSNALLGQSTDSLASLIDLFGSSETEALAVDRTASARSATVGVTYDFTDIWQASIDASIADYSGTPASGGVDEIPDPGVEYYVSAQITGSGVFRDDDYAAFGLSFIDSSAYQTYIADARLRYPLNDKLTLNPRLRLAYRDGQNPDGSQILVIPSLGMKYRTTDHWSFEGEISVRWEDNSSGSTRDQNAELLVSLGYRYEF